MHVQIMNSISKSISFDKIRPGIRVIFNMKHQGNNMVDGGVQKNIRKTLIMIDYEGPFSCSVHNTPIAAILRYLVV